MAIKIGGGGIPSLRDRIAGAKIHCNGHYAAVGGVKTFDFDKETRTLRLNTDFYVPGELERKIGIKPTDQAYIVDAKFEVDLGPYSKWSENLTEVRHIVYAGSDEMRMPDELIRAFLIEIEDKKS